MLISSCLAVLVAHAELPVGDAPEPVPVPHFPSRLHAFVWRNWELVPAERMAAVVGATQEQIEFLGSSMGLSPQLPISAEQLRRSYITILRRNWHLLPYEQLLDLLGWDAAKLAYTLREDDFLYAKLGSRKPRCEPIRWAEPDSSARSRAAHIRSVTVRHFPHGVGEREERLFGFIEDLSRDAPPTKMTPSRFSPRYCYSYFAPYGDPLLEPDLDPYPDGYLARLAEAGADGVWLQAVLYKLAPFTWDESLSEGHAERLEALRALVERASRYGIGVYLYLNEPRAMPLAFYEAHPELKGVTEGDFAALCTSVPEVREWITQAVAHVFREVPKLAGAFSISASENLSNCWSHFQGAQCPRCSVRPPAEVVAEVNCAFAEGIRLAGSDARMIVWDWCWPDEWVEDLMARLPRDAWFQSVSEWSLPINRGGIVSEVGEYSISSVGPGPRALRNWGIARRNGLKTIAKIQAGCTWELSAVPYIPAVELVAEHARNLAATDVDGLMLGWTIGGYPSPNLEVVREIGTGASASPLEAMERVARHRYGAEAAGLVVEAWRAFSKAFREFPFHIGTLYTGPMQYGPSNLLYRSRTGYAATMVGFPYDDLDGWRSIYPADVFARQFEAVAAGFEEGLRPLRRAVEQAPAARREALRRELDVAHAAYLHFRTCANQVRFVMAREALSQADDPLAAKALFRDIERILLDEIEVAKAAYAIQCRDSRIAFEASNHYYYVPLDLVEKIVSCEDLLSRWVRPELVEGTRP